MFSREKRCPACGTSFDCGGLFGCWCRKVPLDEAVLRDLRERYRDCLCQACLEAHATRDDATAVSPTANGRAGDAP
jgi:hypothetical protein